MTSLSRINPYAGTPPEDLPFTNAPVVAMPEVLLRRKTVRDAADRVLGGRAKLKTTFWEGPDEGGWLVLTDGAAREANILARLSLTPDLPSGAHLFMTDFRSVNDRPNAEASIPGAGTLLMLGLFSLFSRLPYETMSWVERPSAKGFYDGFFERFGPIVRRGLGMKPARIKGVRAQIKKRFDLTPEAPRI